MNTHSVIRGTAINQPQTPLSLDMVRHYAPSAFVVEPHISRSARYTYVPTSEIIKTYLDHCVDNGWQGLTPRNAENDLPDLMGRLFGVLRRNDVKSVNANGKQINVRGYYGVRFIP